MLCHPQAVYNYMKTEYVTGYVRRLIIISSTSVWAPEYFVKVSKLWNFLLRNFICPHLGPDIFLDILLSSIPHCFITVLEWRTKSHTHTHIYIDSVS